MKKILFLIVGVLLFGFKTGFCTNDIPVIKSTDGLKTLSESFVTEYNKNSQTKLTTEMVNNLTITSKIDNPEWSMSIGKDVIVPIISRECKYEFISSKGFCYPYYIIGNESIKNRVEKFTNMKESGFFSLDDFMVNLKKNPNLIGFCRFSDAKKYITGGSLVILPIDKNENGTIDGWEKIYNNPNDFLRGVWIGKYPNILCENIYISSSKSPNENQKSFLLWILKDGQYLINSNGYADITSFERTSNIEKIIGYQPISVEKPNLNFIFVIGLFVASMFVLLFIPKPKNVEIKENVILTTALNEDSILSPKGIYFDKTHTWAYMEKDGLVKVGLDDFIQHTTGILSCVKMRESGEKIRKGDKLFTIAKDGKRLNLYSPISGTIRNKNTNLILNSNLINNSPYSEGWVYTIEPQNWEREIQFMFMSEKYKKWIKNEFIRLKEFLSNSIKLNTSSYEHIVLQDGGEITEHVLSNLDPEVWEDFQTNFINKSI